MEITLNTIGRGAGRKHAAAEDLLARYGERIGHFASFRTENFATEERFLAAMQRMSGWAADPHGGGSRRASVAKQKRQNPAVGSGNLRLLLLDSRGKSFSTEQFAEWLQRERDSGTRHLVFAVGPADGWSDRARQYAGMLLSLGPMTLPHQLAAVVLAEQIYRAFTIIERHPYHLGHS
jgi:23S rRNA pseudoU1915 N3-methylase RlmH